MSILHLNHENTMNTNPEIFPGAQGGLVKAWTQGVAFEDEARRQVQNVAGLPFIHKWVAIMPDVHAGKGATVGSVIPTKPRDHPRGGGCGYRLRHDGRAHHPQCRAIFPIPWVSSARASSGRAARPHRRRRTQRPRRLA
jgi:hypothetical protein